VTQTNACQVCGSAENRLLVTQGDHEWRQCDGCGFAFLSAMPDSDEAAEIQSPEIGAQYIATYKRKLDSKMRRSRKRVRRLKRRMPGPRLLDVGSNIGCLVEAGREIGLDAVGVEINPVLVEAAREAYPQSRFIATAMEDSNLEPGSFDGLYCSEVIEHAPDNNSFVAALARMLKPGGVIFLTTPGLHEYVGKGDPAGWRDFGAPDHKLYYSKDTLARMLKKHGFVRTQFQPSFGKGLKVFATR